MIKIKYQNLMCKLVSIILIICVIAYCICFILLLFINF